MKVKVSYEKTDLNKDFRKTFEEFLMYYNFENQQETRKAG